MLVASCVGSFLVLALSCLALADHRCPRPCVCFSSVVDCSDLGFTEVPTDDINPKATFWYLPHNLITTLRADSFQLANLLEKKFLIDLRYNKISKIEDNTFSSLDTLEGLDLENNNISLLSHLALKADNLRVLDLSKNVHLQLPEQGLGTPRLQMLNLEGCGLTSIPKQFFKHMEKLELINLSQNKLTALDPSLFQTTKLLRNLDLTFNLFSDMRGLQFHHFPKNCNIRIYGNHIQCTCVSGYIVEILTRNKWKCYNNNIETAFPIYLTRNCSTPLNSTSGMSTTVVSHITASSPVTIDTTTPPTLPGNVSLSHGPLSVPATTAVPTSMNVTVTGADDVIDNNSSLNISSDRYHRNTSISRLESKKYYTNGWIIGGIGALGLITVAVLLAVGVRRRRNSWESNSQRFSILISDEENQ